MAKHPTNQRLELLQGTLDMLILRTLQWGPQHGHGIGQAIRAQSDDLLKVETGSLYPALHRLVKRGWLKCGVGRQRGQPAGEVLPADAGRQGAAVARAGSLVAARGRDRTDHEPGAGEQGVSGMRPRIRTTTTSTTRFAAIWPSASRSGSSAARIRPSARLAALKEFGNVTLTRDSMRGVWRHRWFDAAEALGRDIRFALRSLLRAKGLAATVVVTLALGIGANAAIFSVVRGVLLRPLVNRDEDRLIYIRQSAPGLGAENMTFSVPEINDFKSRVTTISAFGDFSTVDFTLIGLGGEPRMVKAGVVGGSFFDVMGLRPVLGRLLNAQDDGPKAAGAAVLTYRFWTTSLNSDPTRDRQDHPPRSAHRHRGRRARAVGARIRPTPRSSRTW